MYALTYKKQAYISKLFSLISRNKCITLILMLGMHQFSSGLYIFAKAQLAQYLIGHAWQKNIVSGKNHKPWPWADTYPIAQLTIKDQNWFVLAGASGRNLAFAPSHVSSTPIPGELGNSVVVGHRDTQFNSLKDLQKGDLISVKTAEGEQTFSIRQLRIAHQSQVEYMQSDEHLNGFAMEQANLTLITCYPFDSVMPNPSHRYVVRAVAI